MTRARLIAAMDFAFNMRVARMFNDFPRNAEADDYKDFNKEMAEASRQYDRMLADFSDTGARMEDDEALRARILPIAGDDQRRQMISDASGEALDKVAARYNVTRAAAPQDRQSQPRDEADEAEVLARRNLAPESGVGHEPGHGGALASQSSFGAGTAQSNAETDSIQDRIAGTTGVTAGQQQQQSGDDEAAQETARKEHDRKAAEAAEATRKENEQKEKDRLAAEERDRKDKPGHKSGGKK